MPSADEPVLTVSELEALEREGIVRALAVTGGKVSGADGAASLLQVNPSTPGVARRGCALRKRAIARTGFVLGVHGALRAARRT